MSEEYRFERRFNDKMVSLSSRWNRKQLWTLVGLRRDTECVECKKPLDKVTCAWRPLTNAYNRMHRLCRQCVLDMEKR